MTLNCPDKIEAALLYHSLEPVNFKQLNALLNAHLSETKLQFETTEIETGVYAVYSNGEFSIRIRDEDQPLTAEKFSDVLNSPVTSLSHAEMTAIISGHTKHISVTVWDGQDCAPQISETPSPSENNTSETFQTKLNLCQNAVTSLISFNKPDAVLWHQSKQMFCPQQFLSMRDIDFPLALYVHPKPFSSGEKLDDTLLAGFRVDHISQFIGKPLVYNETFLPFEKAFEHLSEFMAYHRNTGEIMPDGECFGRDKKNQVRVNHIAPDDDHPNGIVELTYLHTQKPKPKPIKKDRSQRPESLAPRSAVTFKRPAQVMTQEALLKIVFRGDPRKPLFDDGTVEDNPEGNTLLSRLPFGSV
ncbi:hypothetical protein J4E70_16730 [Pseudohalocynthiibacter aestuariivivens]|jgi:hypothetical protein|uniref:hypothetical protein n=1 Tax=Pseudohalocynthiibacter TaxID=1759417 RepID=UPI001BD601C5|nr:MULTISPECIES: hypothetical protein [Pseudohalocynthiibacter]MBS9718594.1 hypothetical protein [Pseudohalocynthiibacter aestuariivivens]MCK0103606.1 hypothetical protein [Pseudohalocynthiibacter sp. F2068]